MPARPLPSPPASTAPGTETGTTAPASKFHAPQTMSCGAPPVVTRHSLSLSALGWGATSSTRPTITPENCEVEHLVPLNLVTEAAEDLGQLLGVVRRQIDELAQPAHRDLHRNCPSTRRSGSKKCLIWDAVADHRQAIDPHAEGEPGVLRRVVSGRCEDVGVDDPAPQQFDPAGPAQVRHPDPSQVKHEKCISAEGSVNGKKCGWKRTWRPDPKNSLAKYARVPLRSAKVMSSSTARPSIWWKTGVWVASIVSRPIGAPGRHDVDRRVVLFHVPGLHRTGLGPQQHALGVVAVIHVQRVGLEAGRVRRGGVEGIEVVVRRSRLRARRPPSTRAPGRCRRSRPRPGVTR